MLGMAGVPTMMAMGGGGAIGCEQGVEAWVRGENDRNEGQRERKMWPNGDDCQRQKRLLTNSGVVDDGQQYRVWWGCLR